MGRNTGGTERSEGLISIPPRSRFVNCHQEVEPGYAAFRDRDRNSMFQGHDKFHVGSLPDRKYPFYYFNYAGYPTRIHVG